MIKYVLLALIFGGATGYLNNNFGKLFDTAWAFNYAFEFSLLLLLFAMGFTFGMDKEAMGKLRKKGFKILVVPFSIALGSIFGGLVGGYVLGIGVVGSMAVSAGFGWYTLAGPMVGQFFGAELGAIGFLANFLRELFTVVTVPLVAKADRYAPVAFGGATTMDTTLPVIVKYCGSEALITAFSSGFALSIIAPFTITTIATIPH